MGLCIPNVLCIYMWDTATASPVIGCVSGYRKQAKTTKDEWTIHTTTTSSSEETRLEDGHNVNAGGWKK